jgi:glycerophosphoryl diester phosphodiesterase
MLEILAHRGLWHLAEEQNTLEAIELAFSHGFGVETDIRYSLGKLVVSHDPSTEVTPTFLELLEVSDRYEQEIAVNIKSSGLAGLVASGVNSSKTRRLSYFDMAVPDALIYLQEGLPVLWRVSEFEAIGQLPNGVAGLWIDDFSGKWLNSQDCHKLSETGLDLYFVSQELHQPGQPSQQWQTILELMETVGNKIKLCTDLPFEAREFFR